MARRQLDQKRIIITGASSGIGRELAVLLAQQNCRLILNARREERLQQLATELGEENTKTVAGDICHASTREALIEMAQQAFGGIDILINNAGIGAIGPFAEASEERLRQVMEVNFFAATELTRLVLPVMDRVDNPLIANIGSVLGHFAVPLKSEYCASKFALHGWSDSLRTELVDQGIDVLIVSPSTTDSEFFDSVIEDTTGKNWKLATAKSPNFVARKTVSAIKRGKHEIILTKSGKGMVMLDRLFPWLAHKIVSRFGK